MFGSFSAKGPEHFEHLNASFCRKNEKEKSGYNKKAVIAPPCWIFVREFDPKSEFIKRQTQTKSMEKGY